MKVILKKKPKNPIIIEGFPGFGLIGTIATEYLIDHLQCEEIGKYWFDEIAATVAIHEGKIVQPVSVYYHAKHNLVIVHSISGGAGIEWKAAEFVLGLAKDLNAKEIISLEGVGSPTLVETAPKMYYYTSKDTFKKKMEKIKLDPLKEGIIMGITSAMMVMNDKIPLTCFFAETHTNLPDSKAAAKVIEILDKYLGLKVDPKPLMKQAEKFEDKLKNLMEQGQQAQKIKDRKDVNYFG